MRHAVFLVPSINNNMAPCQRSHPCHFAALLVASAAITYATQPCSSAPRLPLSSFTTSLERPVRRVDSYQSCSQGCIIKTPLLETHLQSFQCALVVLFTGTGASATVTRQQTQHHDNNINKRCVTSNMHPPAVVVEPQKPKAHLVRPRLQAENQQSISLTFETW